MRVEQQENLRLERKNLVKEGRMNFPTSNSFSQGTSELLCISQTCRSHGTTYHHVQNQIKRGEISRRCEAPLALTNSIFLFRLCDEASDHMPVRFRETSCFLQGSNQKAAVSAAPLYLRLPHQQMCRKFTTQSLCPLLCVLGTSVCCL